MADENQQQLRALQCPFNWKVTTNITNSDDMKEYNSNNNYQFYPLPMFMHDVMSVYIRTKNQDDFETVRTKLQKCEDDLIELQERAHPEISLTVVQHVFDATRMHAFYSYNKIEEFESQYQNVTPVDDLDLPNMDKGTMEACKSIAWTKHDLSKSIDFMRKAVQSNPNCDLWYYILGRELRRERRDKDIRSKPSEEEFDCFKRAYKISHNSYFGVFYALCLEDKQIHSEALRIRNSIYETGPREVDVLLRLALGFIHVKNFRKAQDCLKKVADNDSNNLLYLHYQGLYYMKLRQFNEALPFLKKAITDNHLGVEKDYLYCSAKVDESFDATHYVKGMVEKYKNNFPVKDVQHLQLELGVCYADREYDYINAMKCFTKAIELDPASRELKRFKCCVDSSKDKNVYRFLKRDFLPQVYQEFQNDRNVIEEAHTLENLVDENQRLQTIIQQ